MSLFLALTLKSSKKSAFLWKGVLDPRKHVWRDLKISKDMHVSSQDMALTYDSPLFRESLSARLLRKSLHFFPIPPFVPKTTGGGDGGGGEGRKDLISTTITLCWYFLSFSLDLFWLHVEFRCTTDIEELCFSSWPETFCLYVQSSLMTCDGGA